MSHYRIPSGLYALLALAAAISPSPGAAAPPTASESVASTSASRNGLEIYQRFREGLADPDCRTAASPRWRQHFANAPVRLSTRNDDVLPLFGYVVDALRAASLPTEYALIPFIESGYKPGARSASGPAGLWQMIAMTARDHRVPMRAGYDGRLSAIDSTQAAVRYLKTLHGMFAGDWRLAVMAYNTGEYRVLGALKRGGQTARNARPEQLPGLSDITQAYVRKLHALSCVMEQADDRAEWLRSLDRPVPRLQAVVVPAEVGDLATWAARSGQNLAQLQRLNPVLADGRIDTFGGAHVPLLAIAGASPPDTAHMAAVAVGGVGAVVTDPVVTSQPESPRGTPLPPSPEMAMTPLAPEATTRPLNATPPRRHTVTPGDNPWTIARRYHVRVADLLQRNGLSAGGKVKPGQILQVDPP